MGENIFVLTNVNYLVSFISADVLFWTLSTIIQSFVAFVALLGMVTIYRIQIIRRGIESVAESMREYLIQFRGKAVHGYSIEKIVKDIKGLSQERTDIGAFKRANLEFSNSKKDIKNIKKAAIPFFCSVIFLLIASLVLLPFSPALEYTRLGLVFLWIIIFWSFASFVLGLNLLIGLI